MSNIYKVSDIVHYVKQLIDHQYQLQNILIKGEVSNFTNHRSGHWYFTLKDAKSRIPCVMFASYARQSKFMLKEGMKIIVQASLSMYEAGGNIQLYVTKVQSDGLGDLFLQLEEIKKKLHKEGLFDSQHKKPLPAYPMNIGLISAKTGAAIQDMLTTLSRRWPVADVSIYPCLVQGVMASKDLIQTIQKADQNHHDVLIIARGGGSIEDLWCFNDEMLARCIFKCQSVIVTGVGHESDTTLVDYVSDARAATPTAAVELVTPNIIDVRNDMHKYYQKMLQAMRYIDKQARSVLEYYKSHRLLNDPNTFIQEDVLHIMMLKQRLIQYTKNLQKNQTTLQMYKQRMMHDIQNISNNQYMQLQNENMKLHTSMQQYKQKNIDLLQKQIALLDAYSPLKILQRGYAFVKKENMIIKTIDDIQIDDQLCIEMHDGIIHADVKQKEKKHE